VFSGTCVYMCSYFQDKMDTRNIALNILHLVEDIERKCLYQQAARSLSPDPPAPFFSHILDLWTEQRKLEKAWQHSYIIKPQDDSIMIP